MTWTAWYLADGEMPHAIATKKLEHQAAFEVDKFVARMTDPKAQVFWVWIENDETGEKKPVEAIEHPTLDFTVPEEPFI